MAGWAIIQPGYAEWPASPDCLNRIMEPQDNPTGPCVIAVDDDVITRTIIAKMLTQSGFNVIACADGSEMWAVLAKLQPSMILLDIEMPGEDGLALAEDLRSRYGLGLPIVMLTGLDEHSAKAMAYDAGADDYLTKPCDWQRLITVVRRLAA
jgi:DNA-binding response OmpR family regulator